MAIFHVTFTREFDCTLQARNIGEARAAVARIKSREIDSEWDAGSSEWEGSVSGPYAIGEATADVGVVNGEVVAWYDYQQAVKRGEVKP